MKISIQNQLILVFAVAVLAISLFYYTNNQTSNQFKNQIVQIVENSSTGLHLADLVCSNIDIIELSGQNILLAKDPYIIQNCFNNLSDQKEKCKENIEKLKKISSRQEVDDLEQIYENIDGYFKNTQRIKDFATLQKNDSIHSIKERYSSVNENFIKNSKSLINKNLKSKLKTLEESKISAIEENSWISKKLIIILLLTLLVSGFIFFYTNRNIQSSIKTSVSEINNVINSALSGRFEARAVVESINSEFRLILSGFNKSLDIYLDKMNWYEQILDAVPSPLSVTDIDMNWTFFNKSAEQLTGKKRKEWLGKQCNNLNSEACRNEKCGITTLRKGILNSFMSQAATNKDFQIETAYIKDYKGRPIGHVEIFFDITKLRQSVDFSKNEIERLSNNIDLLANGQFNFDKSIGIVTELTKQEHSKIINIYRRLEEISDTYKSLEPGLSNINKAHSEGNLSLRLNGSGYKGEYRNMIEKINVNLDITSKKAFLLENILDSLLLPVIALDKDNTFIFINIAAEKVFHIDRKVCIGLTFENLHPEDIEGLKSLLDMLLSGGHQHTVSNREFYSDFIDICDFNGEKGGRALVFNDITKLKEIDQFNLLELSRLSQNIENIASGKLLIDTNISLPNEYTKQYHIWLKKIYEKLENLTGSINTTSTEIKGLQMELSDGNLSARINNLGLSGEYKKILNNINYLIDTVIIPLKKASTCVKDLSNGFVPALMNEGYTGDFRQLFSDLNQLVKTINELIDNIKLFGNGELKIKFSQRSENDELMIALNNLGEGFFNLFSELKVTIDQIFTGTKQLVTGTNLINQDVLQHAFSQEKIRSNYESVIAVINECRNLNSQIERSANDAVTDLSNTNEILTESIKTINTISSKLSLLNEVKNKIASLSIHANIEVSKAGESGKGLFAIATELDKLFNQIHLISEDLIQIFKSAEKNLDVSHFHLASLKKELNNSIKLVQNNNNQFHKFDTKAADLKKEITNLDSLVQQSLSSSEELSGNSKDLLNIIQHTSEWLLTYKLNEEINENAENPSADHVQLSLFDKPIRINKKHKTKNLKLNLKPTDELDIVL